MASPAPWSGRYSGKPELSRDGMIGAGGGQMVLADALSFDQAVEVIAIVAGGSSRHRRRRLK